MRKIKRTKTERQSRLDLTLEEEPGCMVTSDYKTVKVSYDSDYQAALYFLQIKLNEKIFTHKFQKIE